MPRSVIHVHSTSYGEQGKDQDVEEINRFHRRLSIDLYRLLAQETKLPEYHVVHSELEPKDQKWSGKEEMRIKFVQALLLKEVYLTPEQALEAGIIDDILAPGDPRIDDIFKATSGGAK